MGCVKDEAAHDLTATFTWETGVGLMPALGPSMMFHGQRLWDASGRDCKANSARANALQVLDV